MFRKNLILLLAICTLLRPTTAFAADEALEENELTFEISEDEEAGLNEEMPDELSDEDSDILPSDSEDYDIEEDEEDIYITTSSVQEARNGVVQINTVFTDDDGNKHIIIGGSGILIGTVDGSQYVITNNHIVNPSSDVKKAAYKYYKIPTKDNKWDNINPFTEMVFENDMTVSCSIVNTSEELDLCVLSVSSPNHNRTPLTLLVQDPDTGKKPYDTTDDVYSLGFPEAVTYENPVYYSNDDVSSKSGKIATVAKKLDVEYIQHDAAISSNNCGGPLINKDGFVIGMNELMDDGNNYYSLDANQIARMLDGFGIEYVKITTSEYEKWLQSKDLTTDPVDPPSPVPDPVPVPVPFIPTWLIIVIAVLGALVVAIVVLFIITMLKHRDNKETREKKKAEKKKKKEKAKENDMPKPIDLGPISRSNNAGGVSTDTRILGGDANGTTILGSSPANVGGAVTLGTLIRNKTGDNILLSKQETSVGKDSLHVDYCIRDNSAISRIHAVFKAGQSGVYVEDKGSTNGTFVNGERLEKGESRLLNNGDTIKLANEEFEYRK